MTSSDANYEEAVATLKRRFGNPQMIINRHMESLLNVTGIHSQHDIRGLRKLYDSVESHVQGLKALGVAAQTYGGLFTSVLVNKLPPELRLLVTREMTERHWNLEHLMKVLEHEIDARERAFVPTSATSRKPQRQATAASLMTKEPNPSVSTPHCVYCNKDQASASCPAVADVTKRKEIL